MFTNNLTLPYRFDNYYYDDDSDYSSFGNFDDAVIIEGRNRPSEEKQKKYSNEEQEQEEPMTRDTWIREVLGQDPDQEYLNNQDVREMQTPHGHLIQYPVLVHHTPYVVWPQVRYYLQPHAGVVYTTQSQQHIPLVARRQSHIPHQHQGLVYGRKR